MNGYTDSICPVSFQEGIPEGTVDYGLQRGTFPGTPHTGAYPTPAFMPSSQAIEKVWIEDMRSSIDAEYKRQLLQLEYKNRKEQDERKALWKEKLNRGIFERKIHRDNATFAVFENADGKICIQMQMVGEPVYYSPPVLNVSGLKMVLYHTFDSSDCVAVITWDATKSKITISDQNLCSDGMRKALEKQGVCISTLKERKKEVTELVFAYLASKANHILLPRSLGWNKVGADWVFASCPGETIIGIKNGGEWR